MDRNTIIGLVLIFLVVIVFSYLSRPSEEELAYLAAQRDSVARVERYQDSVARLAEEANRSFRQDESSSGLVSGEGFLRELWTSEGSRASAGEGTDSTSSSVVVAGDSASGGVAGVREALRRTPAWVVMENDLLAVSLRSLGAQVRQVQLKGYRRYHGDSLLLYSSHEPQFFGFRFWTSQHAVHTRDVPFVYLAAESVERALAPGDTARVTFVVPTPEAGRELRYTYRLPYGSYAVDLEVDFVGMDRYVTSSQQYVDLEWSMISPQQERGVKKEGEYTRLSYYLYSGKYEEETLREKPRVVETKDRLSWVGYKQQFFSAILKSEVPFSQSRMQAQLSVRDSTVAEFSSTLMLPFDGGREDSYRFELFYGPNHYTTLRAYESDYEQVIPLGGWLVGWINRYVVIPVFNWLNGHIASYGVIILILTLLIKIVIFPLTFRSYKSQAKMRVLKPLVDQVTAKYTRPEDAMKKQQATMDIYRRAGVSPMGGCLPMLIQFPILIAMFRFFPASFELRQQSFLWADDLSSYDSVLDLPFTIPFYGDHVSLFTLLMAVTLFITSWMNMKQTADMSSAPQMKGMRFMMLYVMPIMMVFWFNDYSSALSYYYFLASLVTILQTWLIRRTINEEKLFERLKARSANYKAKPRRSTFMERLERMQREQEKKLKRR